MEGNNNLRTLFLTVIAEVISFGVLIPIVPLLLPNPLPAFSFCPTIFRSIKDI